MKRLVHWLFLLLMATAAFAADVRYNGIKPDFIIDVRTPDEFSAGHIPGAINRPLSTFRASELPASAGKVLVLNCAAGRRSAMALDKCEAARVEVDTHLAGGFGAWLAAGLQAEA